MHALTFDGSLNLSTVAEPTPRLGEALVRVRMAGVCNTDLELMRGYKGFKGVLGHEFVGEVVAGNQAWMGRRVCGEINLSCGVCPTCQRGMGRHCPQRSVLGILGKDGCFAELLTLPMGNLHAVPDAVEDRVAVFVEPLAAAFEVLEQVALVPQDRVLILGDGKLGLLVAMVIAQMGCDVVVAGRHRRKLAIASAAGARVALGETLDESGFDVVVEATGSAEGLREAMERVRPRGTLVLKSTYHGVTPVDTAKLVIDEITVVGSRCGAFAPALRALAAGRVDPRPLIEASYSLARGVEALEHAARPGVLKVLLEMGVG